MIVADSNLVASYLPYPELIAELASAFKSGAEVPLRSVHKLPEGQGADALYIMPAWSPDALGMKLVTVAKDNVQKNLPLFSAIVLMFDRKTGRPSLLVEGLELTWRRTAAVSALAAQMLAKQDAKRLLIIGAGSLCSYMAEAHTHARNLSHVEIWARNAERARAAADVIRGRIDAKVTVAGDLAEAAAAADIVCCATSATEPVLFGRWLKPGVHVDLVGTHTPTTREVDDEVMTRGRIWMDTSAGCLAEAGDILIPLNKGLLPRDKIMGDLADLVRGDIGGRDSADEITVFKSVGSAIEDIAAANLLTRRLPSPI